MSAIWADVASALASVDIPKGADAYIATTLPDQYIVYNLVSGVGAQFADNDETYRRNRVQISLYSRGGLMEADISDIVTAMKAAGFTRGPDIPLPYVESTRHFGLAMDFYLVKEE